MVFDFEKWFTEEVQIVDACLKLQIRELLLCNEITTLEALVGLNLSQLFSPELQSADVKIPFQKAISALINTGKQSRPRIFHVLPPH